MKPDLRALQERCVTVTEEWVRQGNKVLYRQKIGDTDWEGWRELAMSWPFAEHVASLSEVKLFPCSMFVFTKEAGRSKQERGTR